MSDLHELFERDPLQYTQQDISTIVGELRKAFIAFAQNGDKKAGSEKVAKAKEPKKILSLDDLET